MTNLKKRVPIHTIPTLIRTNHNVDIGITLKNSFNALEIKLCRRYKDVNILKMGDNYRFFIYKDIEKLGDEMKGIIKLVKEMEIP